MRLFIFIGILAASLSISAQKNAFTARPLNALTSEFGIAYERLIYKQWSLVLYGEYINGPLLLSTQYQTWLRNSMNVNNVNSFSYEGYGGVPEIRYYFKQKRAKELEDIDPTTDNKITGWFLGAYFPIRKFTMQMRINSAEYNLFAIQKDFGTFKYDGWMYGAGIEGGKHWVWGLFSLDIYAGIGYSTGVGGQAVQFNFDRSFNDSDPTYNSYTKTKYLGFLGNYLMFTPRLGVSMGVAF
ncbi:MAG: DUF3575 domain-containing protein [Bacteroidota bacterium]|nr:DUF3575 domain-containing protein [Bacteroidota bacterium]